MKKSRQRKGMKQSVLLMLLLGSLLFSGCAQGTHQTASKQKEAAEDKTKIQEITSEQAANPEEIPAFSGEPFVIVDDNQPSFTKEELITTSYESYGELDTLDRCQVAEACIGQDLMPTEKRGQIGQVKPTGWQIAKYDSVDGKYLYNRCHLIGYQLSGENANEKNLITGTRYLNVDGMLPFENMVADYVKETGNHVLYRVTPVFEGENLVATGVQMEGESVEDEGEGILFHVFVYNNQPGITIDYATGNNWVSKEGEKGNETDSEEENAAEENVAEDQTVLTYIVNTNTHKFHRPTCSSVASMKEKNKEEFTGSKEELLQEGYDPCKNCNP